MGSQFRYGTGAKRLKTGFRIHDRFPSTHIEVVVGSVASLLFRIEPVHNARMSALHQNPESESMNQKKSHHFRTLCAAVVTLALFLGAAASSQVPLTGAPQNIRATPNMALITKALQRRLDESQRLAKFPGAQVGFAFPSGQTSQGLPQYFSGSVASGVADVKTNAPLKTTDRLLAGSIGKTFVSTLALMLVEEGKLNLNDKIEKWLGSEIWFAKLPNAGDITLRMLLNHSSGIENHVDLEGFQKQLLKSGGRNVRYEELISYVLNSKPLFTAGTDYHYADTNYILIGMIIEKVAGKTLYDLVTERILKPYKLERTIPSNSLTLPEVANGYVQNKPLIVDGKFTINPQWEWAGGGFASTAEDLARWGGLLYSGGILSPNSMDEMIKSTTVGEGAGYGLGVMISRSKWGRSYGHDSEFPGYLSDLRYYTRYKLAISVMVNSDETPGVDRFLATAADDFAEIIINATTKHELSQTEQVRWQKFAEDWLDLIHTGRFDESWNQLSLGLQKKYTKTTWAELMRGSLEGMGKVTSRKLKQVSYAGEGQKMVAVDFDVVFSAAQFKSEALVIESVDGGMRVFSYTRH